MLGQQAVEGKSNEIVAIPRLLERLELTGALITIDAIGRQRDIAAAVRAKGADYLLALKDNWPTLAQEARLLFEREQGREDEVFATVEGDHGRIETRRCRVGADVGGLTTNRRFPGEPRFPGLAMIGMIEAQVEREGRVTTSRRYDLCSALLSAEQFAAAVRAHWGVENRLHWVLDVVFHDDLMRLRTDNGPANMTVVRRSILILNQGHPRQGLAQDTAQKAGMERRLPRRRPHSAVEMTFFKRLRWADGDDPYIVPSLWKRSIYGSSWMKPIARPSSRHTREALALLGLLIRQHRIEHGQTMAMLAERLGVSRGLVQRIKKGDPSCAVGAVFEAASVVGIRLFDLETDRLGLSQTFRC